MRRALVLAAAFAAVACAQQPTTPAPAPASAGGSCNAAAVQFVVGQTFNDGLANQVRQRSGAQVVRVLRPDEVVTMEYRAERLNVQVDRHNRVLTVRCG